MKISRLNALVTSVLRSDRLTLTLLATQMLYDYM